MKLDRINQAYTAAEIEDRFVSTFGMSSEEFKRDLEAELEQATPEQQAEFNQVIAQANHVLPKMNATLERIGEKMAEMSVARGEIKKTLSSLDARVSRIEVRFEDVFTAKPLPFSGGVGLGSVSHTRSQPNGLTVSTPGPSPEGEGRS